MIIFRLWDYLFFEKGWDNSNIIMCIALECLAELFLLIVGVMWLRVFVIGA